MSSRPPVPPSPRPAWSVWLRRRWALVWAWRLLVAPLVSNPKRDPALRDAVIAERGETCACCRRSGSGPTRPPGSGGWLRFEVDHRRPLWAGGADTAANAQVLCSVCHVWKSKGEAPVRAMAKRWARRLGIFHRRPSPAVSVALVLFAAGFVTTRWVAFSLIVLALLWWGPPIWRKIRPSWTGRSMGGGGFNRIPDYQKLLEMTRAGIEGWILRGYWDVRRRAFIARYLPMFALCIHLSGVYTRHFGIDTAVIAARILF